MRSSLLLFMLVSLVTGALVTSPTLAADVVYVSDELWVRLRATPTEDARIVHPGLRSGTELELLEHDLESGYSRVRMSDGRDGWIQTQYLVTQPIASDRLDAVERQLRDLERENASLAAEVDTLTQENVELRQRNEELAQQADSAERTLEAVAPKGSRPVLLDRQTKVVEEMNALLRREVDDLVKENQTLAAGAERRWMLTGVGLLAVGIALGALVTRRRRSW